MMPVSILKMDVDVMIVVGDAFAVAAVVVVDLADRQNSP